MRRCADSERVTNFRKVFYDACVLELRCGTNGFHGGNSGCETYVKFVDQGGNFHFSAGTERGKNGCELGRLTLRCQGDAELRVLIDALRYAADSLERESTKRIQPAIPGIAEAA